jgi:hypothetical protein
MLFLGPLQTSAASSCTELPITQEALSLLDAAEFRKTLLSGLFVGANMSFKYGGKVQELLQVKYLVRSIRDDDDNREIDNNKPSQANARLRYN